MKKLFLLMILLNCTVLNRIENFNDILKILYSQKGILIFVENQQDSKYQNFKENLESFVSENSLGKYYEFGNLDCEKFTTFCEAENLDS